MSSIDPTTSTTSTRVASGADVNPNSLTADALLMYCQIQLNSLDSRISDFLNEQRLNLARKKALGDIENMMKKYADVPKGSEQWADYDQTWTNAINSLPSGDPMRVTLQNKYDELAKKEPSFSKDESVGTTSGIHVADPGARLSDPMGALSKQIAETVAAAKKGSGFTKGEWTGLTGDIQSMLDDVSGNAEMNMVQLQSIMAQRQTAIQLTTSLLAKYDDGTKSIVANIGR